MTDSKISPNNFKKIDVKKAIKKIGTHAAAFQNLTLDDNTIRDVVNYLIAEKVVDIDSSKQNNRKSLDERARTAIESSQAKVADEILTVKAGDVVKFARETLGLPEVAVNNAKPGAITLDAIMDKAFRDLDCTSSSLPSIMKQLDIPENEAWKIRADNTRALMALIARNIKGVTTGINSDEYAMEKIKRSLAKVKRFEGVEDEVAIKVSENLQRSLKKLFPDKPIFRELA